MIRSRGSRADEELVGRSIDQSIKTVQSLHTGLILGHDFVSTLAYIVASVVCHESA